MIPDPLAAPLRRGRPRTTGSAHCDRCGRSAGKLRSRWPEGGICGTCFHAAVRTTGTCPNCGHHGMLPGLNGDQPIWSFGETEPAGQAEVAIGHGEEMPSRLVLPVVPGADAPTGLPPCPGLRGEPCRDYQPFENGEPQFTETTGGPGPELQPSTSSDAPKTRKKCSGAKKYKKKKTCGKKKKGKKKQ